MSKFLKKNNIVTKEVLEIFGLILLLYIAYLISFFEYHSIFFALGFSLMSVGGLCNLSVMDFNNNKMPVSIGVRAIGASKKKYPKRNFCRLISKTKLSWLADRFCIGKYIYSISDFVLSLGVVVIILKVFFFV